MNATLSGESRLREICQAFSLLATKTKGLRSLPNGSVGQAANCAMLLVAEENGSQVRMDIFVVGAHLIARSGLGAAAVGSADIEDRLTVDLSKGYHWDHATFASPDEMAFILLKHMLRRMVAVTDLNSHPEA